MIDDMLETLRKLDAEISALPPMPRGILAHHSVPWGKYHRQWMTNGQLYIWVNRGEVADLPIRRVKPDTGPWDDLRVSLYTGIPIYNV